MPITNKDVRFCPLLSVGIKELYLHATAGLAKPPISLERWLFKYEDKVANGGPGYERPFQISRLAARDYDRPHAATKHGEELNKVAAAEGVSFLGGVFFALRNWRVMQLSADVLVYSSKERNSHNTGSLTPRSVSPQRLSAASISTF